MQRRLGWMGRLRQGAERLVNRVTRRNGGQRRSSARGRGRSSGT